MTKDLCCMRPQMAGKVVGYMWSIFSFLAVLGFSIALGLTDGHTKYVPVLSIFLAMSVLEFLSSALLIVGSMENRHIFLLPWLIVSGIALAEFLILLTTYFIFVASNGGSVTLYVVISVPIAALFIYMYSTVLSLFQHIKAQRKGEERSLN